MVSVALSRLASEILFLNAFDRIRSPVKARADFQKSIGPIIKGPLLAARVFNK